MARYRFEGGLPGTSFGDFEIVGSDGQTAKVGDEVELDEARHASYSARYAFTPVSETTNVTTFKAREGGENE